MTVNLGIDIGGTYLRALCESTQGRSVVQQVPVPWDLKSLLSSIRAFASESRASSIALGLPGRVTPDRVEWLPNLSYLNEIPLAALVTDDTGVPCRLANDGRLTLLAEVLEGVLVGRQNALLVTVGTGIGGAALLGGSIQAGATGRLGSFGWLPVGEASLDPDHGPWEQQASGTALRTLATARHGSLESMLSGLGGGGEEDVTLLQYGRTLGRGIAGLVSVFDPEVVVLGGGVGRLLPQLHETLLNEIAMHGAPGAGEVPLLSPKAGPDAGVIGALLLARDPGVMA